MLSYAKNMRKCKCLVKHSSGFHVLFVLSRTILILLEEYTGLDCFSKVKHGAVSDYVLKCIRYQRTLFVDLLVVFTRNSFMGPMTRSWCSG